MQEVVGRWAAQQEKELKLLSRTDGARLFSNLTRGNHYLVQAEGYLNNSGSGQTSEMALIWNRTLPVGSVSVSVGKQVHCYLKPRVEVKSCKFSKPHRSFNRSCTYLRYYLLPLSSALVPLYHKCSIIKLVV